MLHEDDPGQGAAKEPTPIPQILDHAFSLLAHGRVACVDGFCLGLIEESHAQDE